MRLIDADALMRDIIKRFGCKPYIEVGNKAEYVHNIIDDQPTAYDPDKVVAELEEKSDDIPIQYEDNYEKGFDDGIGYAIDIIWKGGV